MIIHIKIFNMKRFYTQSMTSRYIHHIIPHRGFVVHGNEIVLASVLHKVVAVLPAVQRLVGKPVNQKQTVIFNTAHCTNAPGYKGIP